MTATLSKPAVLTGLRWHKALWWREHEPCAPELKPSDILLDRFDQGRQVGQLAREHMPGGVMIGTQFISMADRIALTRRELQAGANLLYEAAFAAGGVHVLLDILERGPGGFRLIEVQPQGGGPGAAAGALVRGSGNRVRRGGHAGAGASAPHDGRAERGGTGGAAVSAAGAL
jgi:hypothetical protein